MFRRYLSFLTLAAFFILPVSVSAQSFDEIRRQMRGAFGDRVSQYNQEYREYRDKVNKEFAISLGLPWVPVDRTDPEPVAPQMVVPDEPQPVCSDPVSGQDGQETILSDTLVFDPGCTALPQPQPVVPMVFEEKTDQSAFFVDYYNSSCSVHFNPSRKALLTDTSESSVKAMWNQLSGQDYDNVVSDCLSIRDRLSLCDWGYLKLADAVAKVIYDNPSESDCAVVLQAFLMNQSGYMIRLGRDDADCLHLLIATADDIIGKPYWNYGGVHYYLADDSDVSSLFMVKTSFPGEKSVRLIIDEPQNLDLALSPERILQSERYEEARTAASVNENQMVFWSEYPVPYRDASTKMSWYYYANTPVSESVRNTFYPGLESCIKGKTQLEAVNMLLNFVQTAFQYKTDKVVWGEERSFFPEETLFYEYSDCEDRAILFSRIIRDLLGLDVLLVYYPNHLATAVCLTEECYGDKLIYKDRKYVICDPTYINAAVGKTMTGCDNASAEIIVL